MVLASFAGEKSWSVFSHLTVEKSTLYRAILQAFVEAKASFALHLRPGDVQRVLTEGGLETQGDVGSLEAELSQLCEWGNLEAHEDRSDVSRVEDFYRKKFLYQLTSEGEAAERALQTFHEVLRQPGELQTTALVEIRQYLGELLVLSRQSEVDEGRLVLVLRALTERFEQLTSRAQMFLRSLQQRIDLREENIEEFLGYKQSLIDYLERFIGELVIATHETARQIEGIEAADVERLLEAAARRDMADALDSEKAERFAEMQRLWHARWTGLRGWFIGQPSRQSQAQMLRGRARSAIPALLGTVARINDRRIARSDRVADLQTLARWFAEAPSEGDAHRLWRAAFALAPARHLKVNEETLDEREQNPVSPQTSWLDAAPVRIAPRIRQFGRHMPKGATRKVIDRSAEKALLAALARDEAEQIEAAQHRLATGTRMRISELGILENPAEFDLLLDLLGEALAAKTDPREIVSATSSDGALGIRLEPAGDCAEVVLATLEGTFTGEDHFITISRAFD